MKRAVLVLALLRACSAAPAWAGEPEKAQLRRLHEVPGFMVEAVRHATATRGQADIAELVIKALPAVSRELVILHGVHPENEGDLAAIARWNARTRVEQLADNDGGARRIHNSVTAALRAARYLTRRKPALAQARADLGNALAVLDSFEWTLPYAAAQDAPVIGRPGIGHGSRHRTVNRIHRGFEYDMRHYAGPWLLAYEDLGPAPGVVTEWAQLAVIAGAKHRAIGLVMGLYDEPANEACQVLEAFRLLWMEAGRAYHFAFHADALTDGWRTSIEAASQAAFELPLCEAAR